MTGVIVDVNGNPINLKELKVGIDDAQLTGIKNIWNHESIASGLTPTKLEHVLTSAAQGEPREFFILAEEMEERDPHYLCELNKRKFAVSGIEPIVEAGGDDQRSLDIAEEVREVVRSSIFDELVDGCLDGLGKGYSAVQQDWETSARQWMPKKYTWRDQRCFSLDKRNGYDLRLLTESHSIYGEPLNPFQWVIHRPRIKMGLPIRGALARLCAVSYMCKSFVLGDWVSFSEAFGMPIRIGKYHRNATPDEKATLRRAVTYIGSDAAAIIPESMKMEFLERAKSGGGEALYEGLSDWLNKQISKGVLGQTMSAEDGSSNAQAQVHNEVRLDIRGADIRQLENTMNKYFAEPFVKLNHGPQKFYPKVKFPVSEPDDLSVLTNALKEFVPLGMKVSESQVRDKLALREPTAGEAILGIGKNEKEDDENNDSQNDNPKSQSALSINSDPSLNGVDEFDEIDEIDEWEPQLTSLADPLQDLLDSSNTEEDFLQGLPSLIGKMDSRQLVKRLASAMFKSRGVGDA